ncbi:hypothetical protein KDU71_06485 [Carboxylicivirga sediminis]|uniref:Lipoprotein n=1 Tax=Carboxylicivirga sediminis TaxID=2006564 RepID=A0A941IXA3_9BACT|nr:hypothetical protein [Carboxylicivirga sediminis]MBR8535199.1 hypothetical protein [Carboxylicivirga sediminis]
MQKLFVLILLTAFVTACNINQQAPKNQGVINYKIAYPDEIQKKGYASFLPTKMETTFKNKNYKVSIKGELSLYSLEYISRANGDSATTLFRVFDKRMFHNHKTGEHLFLFEKHGESRVEFINDTHKQIAGLIANKALVYLNGSNTPNIEVYYSEEVKFNRPKENSPFDDIPGVLLEFSLPYKDLNLTFTAQNIELKKINDKEFATPNNYTQSDSGEIAELVSSLIQ